MDKEAPASEVPETIDISYAGEEEDSSNEGESVITMTEEEEDLILRMYRLVGNRWDIIGGRIPGKTAEEIEKFWLGKHGVETSNRRPE